MKPETIIDLSKYEHLLVISLSGLLTTPIINLGYGPDMYIAKVSDFKKSKDMCFLEAINQSFYSFGIEPSKDFSLSDPKVLVVPISDGSELAIKNALIISDTALAIFNKKYFPARAQFINWDRKKGKVIGAIRSAGVWKPIQKEQRNLDPAIMRPIGPDFWDWFLSSLLRNNLNNLGEALFKSMQWEREADFSPHITHRFAFMWIAMESLMPKKEIIQGDFVRRYALLVGAPRGADSMKIMKNPAQNLILKKTINKNSKKWVKIIEEMYSYRCAIMHDGSNDLISTDIDPNKVDWFYHIAKSLCVRAQSLIINGLIDKITTVDDLWENYAINFIYSNKNKSIANDSFLNDHLIEFDWKNKRFPDLKE